ncbi:hypothetical protein A9Z42_0057000 [Trichoderma parareesei]|uniref:Protein kinase domain-containing protein n=1 Tax=Trichoderma parareesei TaxID=858221 RepID=A0A2H2ZPJ7_TRIPA|nr:hypothetical protein A9Z42_0057000 [Trichoderma parareesei]
MASESMSNTSEFTLLDRKEDGTWTAIRRTNPGEKDLYIALPWSMFDVPIPNDPYAEEPEGGLVTRPEVQSWVHVNSLVLKDTGVVYQILNHKNIVSIADSIKDNAGADAATSAETDVEAPDYMVWDHCAQFDLSARLEALRESPDEAIKESFCWHVLTSVLEAITYLHDGKRLVDEEGQRWWKAESTDWTPILHGKIEPQNVLFQKKRQGERHDPCKLANFRWAVALNHTICYEGEEEDELDEDGGSADSRFERLEESLSLNACVWKCQNPHEHSIDTELCSLGRLIFTMMTGEGREDEIYATYTGYFEREWEDRGQYSEQLETVVRFLLDRRHYLTRHAEVRIERVLPLTEVVMEYFREWQRVDGN